MKKVYTGATKQYEYSMHGFAIDENKKNRKSS